jgi:hypothetical protein
LRGSKSFGSDEQFTIANPHLCEPEVMSSSTAFNRIGRPLFSPSTGLKPLTATQSHRAVLSLYRKIVRILPRAMRAYEIEGEADQTLAAKNIRDMFDKNRSIHDVQVIEVLRHKAELDLEETLLMHKTKSHVHNDLLGEPMLAQSIQSRAPQILKQKLLNSTHSNNNNSKNDQSQFLDDFLRGTA